MAKPIDIALLISFFGVHGSKVRGRTRIQKDICILTYRDQIPFTFEFEPNYYGPYSGELTDILETLVAAGLLEESIVYLPRFDVRRYDYALTQEGRKMFKGIQKSLVDTNSDVFRRLKSNTEELEKMSIPEVAKIAKKCSGIQSIS